MHGREQSLRIVLQESPWNQADIHKILLTSDFEVTGLNKDLYQYGLGVPLIAVRETQTKKGERSAARAILSRRDGFPADRLPGAELAAERPQRRHQGSSGMHPRAFSTRCTTGNVGRRITKQDRPRNRPDHAAGLHVVAHRPRSLSVVGPASHPSNALERANLLLIRPYEPHKIPVVMVHGLISTPLAWIPMLNELLRNPEIQDQYQFLLYMYPTGVPIPIAAASLRESLLQAKQMYNPDGSDPTFDQMVLLGHSMGGILSRMMVVSSGDQLWRLYSDRSFDDILGPRPVLDELRRYFFFEPLPFREPGRLPGHAAPRIRADARCRWPGRLELDLRPRQHP